MARVIFVCWGNICRSPMAAVVTRAHLDRAGIEGIEVDSAATSREELGEPIDPRAAQALAQAGYPVPEHAAHQITAAEIESADLLIAMEQIHLDRMAAIAGRSLPHGVLFSVFDPLVDDAAPVPDPWYRGQSGFAAVLDTFERSMPTLLERLRAAASAG